MSRQFLQLVAGALALAACGGSEAGYYEPPPGAPYSSEEVTVVTPAGVSLAGTLTIPLDAAGPVPAVVTITGSGRQDRDENIGQRGYRPFRQIADVLGRHGIAVLRMDDRGIGGSDAGPEGPTSFDTADDIRAGLAFLRERPEIDGARLAVVGHSEGGVIAPIVAAGDSLLAGVVLLAGPAYTLERINRHQREAAIERRTDLTPDEKGAELARAHSAALVRADRDPWTRAVWDYDPLPTAREVRAPVLIIHGTTDRQITPEQADTLAAAFRAGGNPDVTVRMFEDTNHFLLADPDGRPDRYGSLPSQSVRASVLGTMAEWLATRLDASRQSSDDRAPPMLLGEFVDDYDIRYVVTKGGWFQDPVARYDIEEWNVAGRYLIARNSRDNSSDAGLWTRIDWVELDPDSEFEWAFCYASYDAKSAAEATASPASARDTPIDGCGGFPFSRMRRPEPMED